MSKSPIPKNEAERLLSLGDLDLDYTELDDDFKDIVELAAKISGMEVSLINLIDPFTQWTVANHGLKVNSMPRDESVCQYTIMGDVPFEVVDLSKDERFQNRSYVAGAPNLKYYFGIPLTTKKGINIGSLCILDSKPKTINPDSIGFLKILGREVVSKLRTYNTIANLKNDLSGALKTQKKIAQDVRDPLAGIIGISDILLEQPAGSVQETLEYISLINESSKLVLEVTDDVLIDNSEERDLPGEGFTLLTLKNKLEQLYGPFAEKKSIQLTFLSESYKSNFPLQKSSILQIAGTLISSAINVLPANETLIVELDINIQPQMNSLNIEIKGSKPALRNADLVLYEQVINLSKDLVEKLNGNLSLSDESTNLSYKLTIPFTV
ncbi:MAG: sensor histidine kinase [Bacteroidota bacterium]